MLGRRGGYANGSRCGRRWNCRWRRRGSHHCALRNLRSRDLRRGGCSLRGHYDGRLRRRRNICHNVRHRWRHDGRRGPRHLRSCDRRRCWFGRSRCRCCTRCNGDRDRLGNGSRMHSHCRRGRRRCHWSGDGLPDGSLRRSGRLRGLLSRGSRRRSVQLSHQRRGNIFARDIPFIPIRRANFYITFFEAQHIDGRAAS